MAIIVGNINQEIEAERVEWNEEQGCYVNKEDGQRVVTFDEIATGQYPVDPDERIFDGDECLGPFVPRYAYDGLV